MADVNAAVQRIDISTPVNRRTEQAKLKNILVQAWTVKQYLDHLPLSEDLKEWYAGSCKRLEEIMIDVGVPVTHTVAFGIKTEPEYFRSCKTKAEYLQYLRLYPNARYMDIAKKRISEFEKQEEAERQRRKEAERRHCEEAERKRRAEAERKHREEAERKRREEIERKHQEERVKLITFIQAAAMLSQLWELLPYCDDVNTRHAIDNKAWTLCLKRSDYKDYLMHFPNGVHKEEASKKSISVVQKTVNFIKEHKGWIILSGVVLLLIGLIYATTINSIKEPAASSNDEERLYQQFMDNPNEANFQAYIRDYQHGEHISEVARKYVETLKPQGPKALYGLSQEYPLLEEEMHISDIITRQCDSLYYIALSTDTREAWEDYCKAVPADQLRDSFERIKMLDESDWYTESKAWEKATTMDNLDGYYKYIDMYPNGAHASLANKKIIDMEVDIIMSGEHSELPSMGQTSYGSGPTSRIKLQNNTTYTLSVSYSGPDSKRVFIAPYSSSTVTLKNGSYRCVATVSCEGVSCYAGTETLDGGSYEAEYYIYTHQY